MDKNQELAYDIIDTLPDSEEGIRGLFSEYPISLLNDIKSILTQGVDFNNPEDYETFLSLINPKHALTIKLCDEYIKEKEEAKKRRYSVNN